MFAQVITATVTDRDGLKEGHRHWNEEVRPGAVGFLGSTGGVTDDGNFILVARFESEELARQNSERTEQGESFARLEKCLSGIEFAESTDILVVGEGDKDAAGFVQVMRGSIKDPATYDEMMADWPDVAAKLQGVRTDILGGVTVRLGEDSYIDLIYFTDEASAREGEAKPMPEEFHEGFERMMATVEVQQYLDLREPWIF